jgi:hypothetical protein
MGDHLIEMAVRRLIGPGVDFQAFSIRDPLSESDIEAINAGNVALICGTNLYQFHWHSALTPPTLERLEVPIVPIGVGSSAARLEDTEVSDETTRMIRALHARCAAGSVRDPHSAAVVQHAGVGNAIVTGCPVLFWNGTLPAVRAVSRSRVIITARNWLMHRWPDNVDNPAQIGLMRHLLASFPIDRLVFAIHEEYDARLVDLLDIPRQIVFRSDRPEDYLQLYSDDESVVLAMRLHAGMLALANGVPAVFVGHDTRTYAFCSMLRLPYVELFSDGCPAACVGALRRVLDGDVSSLAAARDRFSGLRHAMDSFLAVNGLFGMYVPPRPSGAEGRAPQLVKSSIAAARSQVS